MTTERRLTRRTLLRAVATGATASTGAGLATGGCATGSAIDPSTTQVVVVWNGGELAEFNKVLDPHRAKHRSYHVRSAGDDIDAFLRARSGPGTRPDVAILPRPGLVTEYAARGWLQPLSDDLAGNFRSGLGDLLRYEHVLYGVWVKAAHKSLFWWRPPTGRDPSNPPGTWSELVQLVRDLAVEARGGGPAPLSIGAADGWVLTDWFENVLASIAPDEYPRLATEPGRWDSSPVRAALAHLAELWRIPGAFRGGGQRALLTQWQDSVSQVLSGRAVMVFGADFYAGTASRFRKEEEEPLETFRFPALAGGQRPMVLGGDAAVVMRGSSTGADLVRRLSEAHAFDSWIQAGGYLSVHKAVQSKDYGQDRQQMLARDIEEAETLQFDLSDQLPGPFTGSDGVGIWRMMQDFFGAVTQGEPVSDAIEQTVGELRRAGYQAREAMTEQTRKPR